MRDRLKASPVEDSTSVANETGAHSEGEDPEHLACGVPSVALDHDHDHQDEEEPQGGEHLEDDECGHAAVVEGQVETGAEGHDEAYGVGDQRDESEERSRVA